MQSFAEPCFLTGLASLLSSVSRFLQRPKKQARLGQEQRLDGIVDVVEMEAVEAAPPRYCC